MSAKIREPKDPMRLHYRRTRRFCALTAIAAVALLFLAQTAAVRGQSALAGFDPNANDTVRVVAVQPDGKILIGGDFTTLSPNGGAAVTRNRIARLNPDGTLDTTFNPNANDSVYAIAVQADGKILAGGKFNNIGGQSRNRIARLHAVTGLADSFDPDAESEVFSIAVQADGKILAGGKFNNIGGQPRNRIARLNAVTGLADSFDPDAESEVFSIVVQADGKILAGGKFNNVGGQTRKRIARLNAATGLADSFNPDSESEVFSIAVQADGKILVGGKFNNIGGQTRKRIARLDAVTGLADSFNPGADKEVLSIAVQADGKVLAGGKFDTIGGQPRNRIARLDPTTGFADTFNPDAENDVLSIAVQADGKILAGGLFRSIGGQTRNRIVRLETDGRLDKTLNPTIGGNYVTATAVQRDGKILIGGSFNTVLGVGRNNIARLNTDGTLDTVFNPNANFDVDSIAVQQDGKILAGGAFTAIGGQTRNFIARLDATTGLADSFDPDANSDVHSIAVQADGKILAGGGFTTIGGQTRGFIARLDATTGLVDSLDPNANGDVHSIAVQTDGKILAGGKFNDIGGQTRNHIARLDATVGVADSFDPNANADVLSIAVQADGKILAGGAFTSIGGQTRNRIARLGATVGLADSFDPNADADVLSIAVQADGRIFAGGALTNIGGQARNFIARLDATTGLADSFNPNANNVVNSIVVKPDGKVLAGGTFTSIGGQPRSLFAPLSNGTAALQNVAVTQTSITWTRGGSSPQFARVTFESSFDNVNYTMLGNGIPQSGSSSWILTGLSLATGQNIYIRARGYYPSGYENGSASTTESVRNVFLTAQTPTPTPTATPTSTPLCPPFITQSTSQAITPGNSTSCNSGSPGFFHRDNSYWRAFNMSASTNSQQYNVTSVSFGIETANASGTGTTQPITVRLYTESLGIFPLGIQTLIATTTVNVPDQALTVLTVPLTATVPFGTTELIMEVFTPDGTGAGNQFVIGSNAAAETGPGYTSAASCLILIPTLLTVAGSLNMHLVFNVNGSCGVTPTPTPTVTPTPTPTSTATATATASATATATSTTTATGTPTATTTATPTATSTATATATSTASASVTPTATATSTATTTATATATSTASASVTPTATATSTATTTATATSTASASVTPTATATSTATATATASVTPTATTTATSTATATATPVATATPTATATATPMCAPAITQSSAQTIIPLHSISCNDGNAHTDNSYWRAFDMTTFTDGAEYDVTSVSFGVESTNVTQSVWVRLYTTTNFPSGFPGSLTQIGSATVIVSSAQNGTVVTTPLIATVPAGTEQLVMELFTPDGRTAGKLFFIGSNGATETGPSFISAPTCGITTPTVTAALGSPEMHVVFNVFGTCGGGATPTPTPGPGTLANISTRLQVGTSDRVIIAGFIVQGSAPKRVLIRAAGPSLANLGVRNTLANPQLELHDSNSAIGMNDDWQTTRLGGVITSDQTAEIQNSGLAPSDPLESAIIATLPPGSYTAIVQGLDGEDFPASGGHGDTGVGIVEVYDLDATSGSLANISTRGFVKTGDDVMIGGFIVVTRPTKVIIRAIGPSLTPFGVPNALARPQMELHDASSMIGWNDDWQTTQIWGIITSDQVGEIQNSQLAPTNPAESAMIATLPPGNYTVIVRGVNNTTGVALVEVYAMQEARPN